MAERIDKILEARLNSMESVLTRLRQLSNDVKVARKGLDDLRDQIDGMGALLQTIIAHATQVRSGLEDMAGTMRTYEQNTNPIYLVKAEDLQAQFENAQALREELDQLRDRLSVNTSSAIRRLRRWSPLRYRKKVEFDDVTVQQLETTLRQAVDEPSPWAYYLDKVQDACDDLFAQYVDLVGGIALRDQGLDKVSRYADDLVLHLLSSFGGEEAMAVPSRHAPQALIQAKHIRIPLPPGWTLWGLPLAARGVGELLRSSKLSEVTSAELIPDVFGTFVLGPAYALAAVLLELDPRDGADQRRAQAIRYTLSRLDEGDDYQRFTALATQIQHEWAAATDASAPGQAVAAQPSGTLHDLYDQVQQRCSDAAYLAQERWDAVQDLSRDLRSPSTKLAAKPELRDILNAMWLARWQHPEDLDVIEESATRATEAAASGGVPGIPGGQSPPSPLGTR